MTNALAVHTPREDIDFSRPVNLTLRIRNGILLQAIRAQFGTVAAFSRETRFPQYIAWGYIAFKRDPVSREGVIRCGRGGRGRRVLPPSTWREDAVRLCALLDLTPEEAFPPEIVTRVKRNTVEVFCAATEPPAPMLTPRDEAARAEIAEKLSAVLDTLMPREKRILERRFGIVGRPCALEEMAREFGCTRERARQIEAKALRKLRHPTRMKQLRGLYETSVEMETQS